MDNFEVHYRERAACLEIKLLGEIQMKDLLNAYKQCSRHPNFYPGIGLLTNYLDSEPFISYASVDQLYEFAKKFTIPYRSAVLVRDDTDREFFELWKPYSIKLPQEVFKVFTDYQKALIWLEENKDTS